MKTTFFKHFINTLDSCLFLAGIALEMVPIDSPQFLDELKKNPIEKKMFFSSRKIIFKKKVGKFSKISSFFENPIAF